MQLNIQKRDPDTYTPLQLEAALCVWEHMLEQRESDRYRKAFADYGTACMRYESRHAAVTVEEWFADWCALEGPARADERRDSLGGHAYDWEIVPVLTDIFTDHGSGLTGRAAAFAALDAMAAEG